MTTGAHDVPWSSAQREWLQALGHDVLMLASTEAGASAVPEPAQSRVAPLVPQASGPRAAARPALPVSPLLRALARAAACSEDDAEFLKIVPELTVLRGNPAARRALWPRLRALRKRGP